MDITFLRIAATVVSFITFLGIVAWAFSRRNAERFRADAQIPFEQD